MNRDDQHRVADTIDLAAVVAACARFEVAQGRRPRILIATFADQRAVATAPGTTPLPDVPGTDDAREAAVAFARMGFDADVGPAAATAERVAAQAIDADVHAIWLRREHAAPASDHLRDALAAAGRPDIVLWPTGPGDLAEPAKVLGLLAHLAAVR